MIASVFLFFRKPRAESREPTNYTLWYSTFADSFRSSAT